MILTVKQQHQLDRVVAKGRELANAKRATAIATSDVKLAVNAALDASVPLSRVAQAAGVQRSLVYHWLGQRESA
jgi:hypothetical protein